MIGAFPSRPTGTQVARLALSGFAGVLKHMPILVLASALAFWLLALGTQYIAGKLGIAGYSFLDGIRSNRSPWFHILYGILVVALAVPLTLATCRFVLLGQTGPRLFSRSGRAFIGWVLTIATICILLIYLTGLMSAPTLRLMSYLFWMCAIGLPIGLLPLFPAVAAETPAADISDRLETALSQWDDNVILLLVASFLAALPAYIAWYGGRWMFVRIAGQETWDKLSANWGLTAILAPLALVLAASVIASFYAWSGPNFAALSKTRKSPGHATQER